MDRRNDYIYFRKDIFIKLVNHKKVRYNEQKWKIRYARKPAFGYL